MLDRLNPEQRAAVTHVEGPLLIFAGAGSGKTRTLTHRIAYLVEQQGVPPGAILAVTFTNKAAAEMRERVRDLVGSRARGMWVGTFHSLCARLLREHAEAVGLQANFAIYDERDRQAVIKQVLGELNIDAERFPPRTLAYRISDWKNEMVVVDEARRQLGDLPMPPDKLALTVYEGYERALRRNNALDFDDLIGKAVELLESDEALCRQLGERFRYVLVDEYQDINRAQYRFVQAICRCHGNLCVVGDDDQSIYSWRGARMEIILSFEQDYPTAKIIKLERNYRSTQSVLDVANALIAQNRGRRPKRLKAQRLGGEPVRLHVAGNEQDEVYYIADVIAQAVRSGERTFRDHAILYRTNAQSRVFEQVFRTLDIPHRLVGTVGFYERKEVRDLLAYLRALNNPADDVSLARIINVPTRGIGDKTVQQLQQHAARHRIGLWEAIVEAADGGTDLGSGPTRKVKAFHQLMERLRARLGTATVPELIEFVIEDSGYAASLYADGGIEASARLDNLRELVSAAAEVLANEEDLDGHDLGAFLERIALVSETDKLDADADAVTLLTLHSAKGLEFPVVFLTGLEEGLCPHGRSVDSSEGIEEERRLCYVGMTRAMDRLYLTRAYRRSTYGTTAVSRPSRFLAELPREGIVGWDSEPAAGVPSYGGSFAGGVGSRGAGGDWDDDGDAETSSPASLDLRQMVSRSRRRGASSGGVAGKAAPGEPERRPMVVGAANDAPYKVGQRVTHAQYGKGIVLSCDGRDVQVAFEQHGVKRLALEYTKLATG